MSEPESRPSESFWDRDATQRVIHWLTQALRLAASIAIRVAIVCAVLAALLFWATLLYAILYWIVIPKATYVVPVFIDYRHTTDNQYEFARANVSLAGRHFDVAKEVEALYYKNTPILLSSKEAYDVSLEIEFQQGALNDLCGVLVTEAEISHQQTILARSVRSFVPTRSTLWVRTLRKLVLIGPLVVGLVHESESASLMLFEEYIEHPVSNHLNL